MNSKVSLKNKTISGLSWSFAEQYSNSGITFITGIILARLLSPREFGLIGMITVFIAISESITNSGFSQALIRKKNCSQEDYSTAFFFNIFIGVFLYLILYLSSGLISDFYDEPQLVLIVRVFGIMLIINSFGLIQRTILIKALNFKLHTKITVIATLISGTIGIIMAYTGFGVWSLVWKSVLFKFLLVLLFWLWSEWRPKFIFNFSAFKEMFSFGSLIMLSNLLNTVSQNVYLLVIGRIFGAVELGFYTRADKFKVLLSQNFSNVINRVSYPVLSSIQDEHHKLKYGYKKILKSTTLISFILMIGLASVAEPLLITLIGEEWLPSVIYLQLLCFVGMMTPLHSLNLNVLKVKGRSDLYLKIQILKQILIVPVIIVGIFCGINLMIIMMIIHSFVAYFVNSYYSSKLINYAVTEQLADVMPSFFVASVMGVCVYILGEMINILPVAVLFVQIVLGTIITIALLEIWKFDAYKEIKTIIKNKFLMIKQRNKI